MKVKNKLLAAVAWCLTAASLAAALAGCAKPADSADVSVSGTSDQQAASESDLPETKPFDTVPKKDYENYQFRVLTLSSGINGTSRFTDEIWVEGEKAEPINDAVYMRNLMIEDRLNVQISAIPVNDVFSTALKTIQSDDAAYEMHCMYDKPNALKLGSEGMTRDWNQIPVIDLSQKWWNSQCAEKLSVMGKLYLMSGAILISEIDDELAMVYNKKLGADNNLDSIYDLVFAGNWTLDTFGEQALAIHHDVDGNGKMVPGEDLFGYVQDPASMTNNWVFSCDLLNAAVDEDGIVSMNVDTDRVQTTLEKLSDITSSDAVKIGVDLYQGLKYFTQDSIYIYAVILRNIELLRDMESDFGIIPYPKYDANQESYLNHVGNASPILTIPITNYEDDERLGSILEAMAIASWQVVKPAYFEVALKEKYARDLETQQMLDIVLESRTYDLGYLGNCGLVGVLAPMIASGNTTFSSSWARQERSQTKIFQKLVDKIVNANL